MKIILPCRCGSFAREHMRSEILTTKKTLIADVAKLRFEGQNNIRVEMPLGDPVTVEEMFRTLKITTEN